ncbi:unnamed protein product [Phytophthora lilii]|uniref:RxLR effector protein n=1 Tax=Phytophthora lilii TaxID=2077276 RepID=A0A9W6TVH2_9STRA|nr:unnamed protein product [Phytophthora lilii]
MRLSYVLLVALATTVLSSSNTMAAPTISDPSDDVSAAALPDFVQSGAIAVDEKRFLRSHEIMDEDEKERASLFKTSKLDKMLSSMGTFKRFGKWKHKGYTPSDIRTKLQRIGGTSTRTFGRCTARTTTLSTRSRLNNDSKAKNLRIMFQVSEVEK